MNGTRPGKEETSKKANILTSVIIALSKKLTQESKL
jgi:hypothetical protein